MFFSLGLTLVLTVVTPGHAQTAPADANGTVTDPLPAGQAPDEATRKITELVHAGNYSEAQQLTIGLLVAYPNDQRLIRAKALIERLRAPGSQSYAPPASRQPAANPNAEQLSGMDKVDYNALILLARQAQQSIDPLAQKTQLLQFMGQSNSFLQKHPEQMLLWQLRAASAISLSDPAAGYDAGQKLISLGAADSNDAGLQELLGQLKNKGWLDRQTAEKHAKYDWILGTWSVGWSVSWHARGVWPANFGAVIRHGRGVNEDFSISGSVIEGYEVNSAGAKGPQPNIRGTILDSGEIRWENYYLPSGGGSYLIDYHTAIGWKIKPGTVFYPSGYVPVISCVVSDNQETITLVLPSQDTFATSGNITNDTVTVVYTKIGST